LPGLRSNTRVNYEDDNFNVGLPVFIIHGASLARSGTVHWSPGPDRRLAPCGPRLPGNHDEPAGTENMSAVDILAACNLVNYYGKLVRDAQSA